MIRFIKVAIGLIINMFYSTHRITRGFREEKTVLFRQSKACFLEILRLIIVTTDSQTEKHVVIGKKLKKGNKTITFCTVQSIKMKCISIDHSTVGKRCIFVLVNKMGTD